MAKNLKWFPAKYGKWLIVEELVGFTLQEYLVCSECGEKFCGSGIKKFPHCPNCGAKMESEGKDG